MGVILINCLTKILSKTKEKFEISRITDRVYRSERFFPSKVVLKSDTKLSYIFVDDSPGLLSSRVF